MTAYFVLSQDVTDLDRFRPECVSKVFPFFAKNAGEVIVASHDNHPDYKAVKKIRLALTTNANAVLAPEFSMPDS